jgi:D-alanine-D-alanine ligase
LKNTTEITPAEVDTALQEKIENIALWIYKACKIQCLARIDFIYTPETDTLYFLEINTIPGFNETSFFPQAIIYSWISIWEYMMKKINTILGINK